MQEIWNYAEENNIENNIQVITFQGQFAFSERRQKLSNKSAFL